MNIRSYQKGDEVKILELDDRALPSVWNRRTPGNWLWKFSEMNPNGHAHIWLAEHNDQMVAHFAAVLYQLKVFDEVVTASHSIGALVELKYQKRGLLKIVGDKLMEDLAKHDIPYTWGFPNKLAYEFEKVALGYEDLANFAVWHIEKLALSRRAQPEGFRKITAFNEDFDQLWETCSTGYEVAVVRKKEYLNWRFFKRPDCEYFCYGLYDHETLLGYVALKLYREDKILRGHIVDIFAGRNDAQTLGKLLDGTLNFFIEKEVDEITVWILGSPLIEMLLIQRGIHARPATIPLILRVNTDHKYKESVLDQSNWYFTMADSTEIF